MRLATIALAAAFALSSTYALATTKHHKKTHHAQNYNYGGGPNNQRGLVGGDDAGTAPRNVARAQPQSGWNNNGWNNNWNSNWNWNNNWNNNYGNPNNRGGLVGGGDSGTRRP
jgi:hypothetical protein